MQLCDLSFDRFMELSTLWGWSLTALELGGAVLVVLPVIRLVKRRRAAKAKAARTEGELTRGKTWTKYRRFGRPLILRRRR